MLQITNTVIFLYSFDLSCHACINIGYPIAIYNICKAIILKLHLLSMILSHLHQSRNENILQAFKCN